MTLMEILNPWAALARLKAEHAALTARYAQLTDRDARGRFTKTETDR